MTETLTLHTACVTFNPSGDKQFFGKSCASLAYRDLNMPTPVGLYTFISEIC